MQNCCLIKHVPVKLDAAELWYVGGGDTGDKEVGGGWEDDLSNSNNLKRYSCIDAWYEGGGGL